MSSLTTSPTSVNPPTMSPQERFFRYFQHEITALQEQMERFSDTPAAGGERDDAVEHCLAGIARLQHEVKDASNYIPAYDQRTYGEAIKALSEKLQSIRTSLVPRPKFAFKTRKNASAISLTDAAELAAQQRLRLPRYDSSNPASIDSSVAPTPAFSPNRASTQSPVDEMLDPELESQEGHREVSKPAVRKPSFSDSTGVTISNHSNVHIILPSSASHATSSGTLSNLRRCIVDMSQPTMAKSGGPFASLTLKNIRDSLVICGQVSGPTHVTGVEKAVLVVSCRQFRMHDCKGVDVYLYCSSRPIIENCAEIRFAPLPFHYATLLEQPNNLWDQVDDFKWLKSGTSPHWLVLPTDSRISDNVWRDIVPGSPDLGLDKILMAVSIA